MEGKLETSTTHAEKPAQSTLIKPQAREAYDSAVTFEEYFHYAQKAREEELGYEAPTLSIKDLLQRKKQDGVEDPKLTEKDFATREGRLQISDEEWANASRAFRAASWGACEHAGGYAGIMADMSRFLLDCRRHHGPIRYWLCHGYLGLGTR